MSEASVRKPKRQRQVKRWLLLNAILSSVVTLLSLTYPVEELSRRVGDMFFRLRYFRDSSAQVALILIDDASLQRYGRWPWRRSLLARVVRAANAERPKALGLDILLSEPEDAADDAQLAAALKDAGNAVLVAKIGDSPQGRLWVEPLPLFAKSAAAVGHAQAVLGPDGICRSVPVRELSLEEPRWAFALELARVAIGQKLEDSGQELRIEERKIPTVLSAHAAIAGVESEPPRFLLIDYRGDVAWREEASPFPTISVVDLLKGKAGGQLQGKAVLIGFGSTEIGDRIPSPVSGKLPMPGVGIHANLLDAILARRNLRPLNGGLSFLLLCLFSCASTWVVLHWPVWRGFAWLAALLAGALLASYLAFARMHVLLDLGPFLCAGALAAPLGQLQSLVTVDRNLTQRLRELQTFLKSGERARRESLPAALRAAAPPSGDLHWKIELLGKLQAVLGTLYSFDETLLESMQEGLAVFSAEGRLVFGNTQWQRFCERHKWSASPGFDEFVATLTATLPAWREARKALQLPGSSVDGELHLGESLWQLRAVRLKPQAQSTAADLIMVVVTDQTARLERDRARAETLAFVTHELRTPLVSIQGFAEFLLRYSKERGGNEAAATIFQESGRLVAIINTYLDVLRLDAGARPMRSEVFQVGDSLKQVARVVQPIAQASETSIRTEIAEELPPLQGDRHLIEGALLNLLSNAIKYSPPGSEVKLRGKVEEEGIGLEVWNPGPAIPAEEMDRLFEPFYRRKEQEETARGWGLGLAFVKRIAEHHGGKVEASSDPGAGTSFRIHLPVSRTVLSEAHP